MKCKYAEEDYIECFQGNRREEIRQVGCNLHGDYCKEFHDDRYCSDYEE